MAFSYNLNTDTASDNSIATLSASFDRVDTLSVWDEISPLFSAILGIPHADSSIAPVVLLNTDGYTSESFLPMTA